MCSDCILLVLHANLFLLQNQVWAFAMEAGAPWWLDSVWVDGLLRNYRKADAQCIALGFWGFLPSTPKRMLGTSTRSPHSAFSLLTFSVNIWTSLQDKHQVLELLLSLFVGALWMTSSDRYPAIICLSWDLLRPLSSRPWSLGTFGSACRSCSAGDGCRGEGPGGDGGVCNTSVV